MAVLDEEAIRDTIAEVLTGAVAGVRAITAGFMSADGVQGGDDFLAAARAMVTPTFSVRIEYEPSPDRPQGPAPIWMDTINVTVTTTYTPYTPALLPNEAHAVKATSAAIASAMRIAFAWPGKLTSTSLGAATGIVSGMLMHVSSTVSRDQPAQIDGAVAGIYETVHVFTGTVLIAAAVA